MILKYYNISLESVKCKYCAEPTKPTNFIETSERDWLSHLIGALAGCLVGAVIGGFVTTFMGGFEAGAVGGFIGGLISGFVIPINTVFSFTCDAHSKPGSIDKRNPAKM